LFVLEQVLLDMLKMQAVVVDWDTRIILLLPLVIRMQ
jgi:hypothetical protein